MPRHQTQRLQRKSRVKGSTWHACRAHGTWMSPSATPATQSAAASTRDQSGCDKDGCGHRWVVDKDVCEMCDKDGVVDKIVVDEDVSCHAKFNACHANGRWMSPSATPATQSAAASPRDQSGPSAPPDPAQCLQCHACHANGSWMSPSATPATQMAGGCRRVPRLPRKVPPRSPRDQSGPSAPLDPAQCLQCHACHANRKWMSPSATPATQMAGGCRRVPRLPRKVRRRHRDV